MARMPRVGFTFLEVEWWSSSSLTHLPIVWLTCTYCWILHRLPRTAGPLPKHLRPRTNVVRRPLPNSGRLAAASILSRLQRICSRLCLVGEREREAVGRRSRRALHSCVAPFSQAVQQVDVLALARIATSAQVPPPKPCSSEYHCLILPSLLVTLLLSPLDNRPCPNPAADTCPSRGQRRNASRCER